jgi:hypothetical protein
VCLVSVRGSAVRVGQGVFSVFFVSNMIKTSYSIVFDACHRLLHVHMYFKCEYLVQYSTVALFRCARPVLYIMDDPTVFLVCAVWACQGLDGLLD